MIPRSSRIFRSHMSELSAHDDPTNNIRHIAHRHNDRTYAKSRPINGVFEDPVDFNYVFDVCGRRNICEVPMHEKQIQTAIVREFAHTLNLSQLIYNVYVSRLLRIRSDNAWAKSLHEWSRVSAVRHPTVHITKEASAVAFLRGIAEILPRASVREAMARPAPWLYPHIDEVVNSVRSYFDDDIPAICADSGITTGLLMLTPHYHPVELNS